MLDSLFYTAYYVILVPLLVIIPDPVFTYMIFRCYLQIEKMNIEII